MVTYVKWVRVSSGLARWANRQNHRRPSTMRRATRCLAAMIGTKI